LAAKRKGASGSGGAGSSKSGAGTTSRSDGRPRIRSSHGGAAGPSATRSKTAAPAKPKRASRADNASANLPRPPRAPAPKTNLSRPRSSADAAPKSRKPSAKASLDSPSVASDGARELAILVATAALDKKAAGLEILDVAGKVDYADFLVLMTGRSDRQVVALAQGIEEALRLKGKRALSVEGLPHAHWVLMDFGDVVVHVFQDEARGLYDLEGLWMDARRIPVPVPEELR
jgi:ribosome-associated protein